MIASGYATVTGLMSLRPHRQAPGDAAFPRTHSSFVTVALHSPVTSL